MSNDTTTRQMRKFLDLLAEKKVTEERFQQILGSGILSDVFDQRVDWRLIDRSLVQRGLVLKRPVVTQAPRSNKSTIWKTIKLGTGLKTDHDFCSALKKNGFKVNRWALFMMYEAEFTAAKKEVDIDLVVKSAADLGLKEGDYDYEWLNRAFDELGLSYCPPEVGPQLRLQYNDQPMGESLRIVMRTISVSPHPFSLFFKIKRNKHGLYLKGVPEESESFKPTSLLVFRLRK